jgi:thioredoxin-related protein
MKTAILSLCILICCGSCIAQKKPSTAKATQKPYLKFPSIPPMDLILFDSSHLTKEGLPKNKKTLIMFFSPSCDHCQHQTKDLVTGMDSLANIQIVMAAYQPLEEIREFFKKYELARYSNIKIGRDSKFMLPPFYDMKNLPYLALYDQKGNLLTTFEGNVTVAKLANAFETKK